MKKLIIIIGVLLLNFQPEAFACSSWMWKNNGNLYFVNNVDQWGVDKLPGMVVINYRNVLKENISFYEIKKGKKQDLQKIQWISKYGSITYNPFGRSFITGGMNEEGLYVSEMSAVGTVYSYNDSLPTFAAGIMMQYCLDQFKTVDEVINWLSVINIDNLSPWHYLIADKYGNSAAIDYDDGEIVVHKNENMPYKSLTNYPYKQEKDSINSYKEFGGTKEIDMKETYRLVLIPSLLNKYNEKTSGTPVQYSFEICDKLNRYDANKWQIVYDVKNMRMYFRTSEGRDLRHIDFASFDFSKKSSAQILDINTNYKGNVSSHFNDFTLKINKKYLKLFVKETFPFFLRPMFWGVIRRSQKYEKSIDLNNL